jgi:hypothetical protein
VGDDVLEGDEDVVDAGSDATDDVDDAVSLSDPLDAEVHAAATRATAANIVTRLVRVIRFLSFLPTRTHGLPLVFLSVVHATKTRALDLAQVEADMSDIEPRSVA